jgi:sulfite reductase (ferredoxin)
MSEQKLSPVEAIKRESNYLRGDIAQELVDGKPFFSKDSIQLLKHHGSYQQEDRDLRGKGQDKEYSCMVRTVIPGGQLTADQLLAQLDLCEELSGGTLRVTTRQTVQYHFVPKSSLRALIHRINEIQLSTLAACGDVSRNVMCCPAAYSDGVHHQLQQLADDLRKHFAPRTRAYYELWVMDSSTGQRELVGGGAPAEEVEPIYGQTYLPRKFKIGIALPEDNCVDVHTQDIGLLAIVRDNQIAGFNLLVGGGLGVTPSNKKTFPALGQPLAFVTPDQVIDVATAIVKVQRDFGNREDRKVARLKYLVHNWGLEKFKAKVQEYYGGPLADPEPVEVSEHHDHTGWQEQGDGRLTYGLNLENGRIKDDQSTQIKTAIREICRTFQPGIRLTPHQSILFTDLEPGARDQLDEILRRNHVRRSEDFSTVRRWAMACVALPTCGLAITDSERALPGIIDQMEVALEKLGLSSDAFTVRMTGCPNGCARPYNADIGLVGKAKGRYTVFLGGRRLGDRLNFLYQDLVPADEIVPLLTPIFAYYAQDRLPDETFGDFCHRKGKDDLAARAETLTTANGQPADAQPTS